MKGVGVILYYVSPQNVECLIKQVDKALIKKKKKK